MIAFKDDLKLSHMQSQWLSESIKKAFSQFSQQPKPSDEVCKCTEPPEKEDVVRMYCGECGKIVQD